MSGKLWIVGTPIGNREDISSRAVRILDESDSIVAEDTRVTHKLLYSLGIREKKIYSLCDYTEKNKSKKIIDLLSKGSEIALVSDAGMPCISDPGYVLIRSCHEHGIPVRVVPGPCSIISCLSGSGIASIPFTFLGFLPRSQGDRRHIFEQFISFDSSIIFFERKNRVMESLSLAYEVLGDREVCIAREVTKVYEEYIHCRLSSHMVERNEELRGEITVIIGRCDKKYRTPIEEVYTLYATMDKRKSIREDVRRLQTRVYGYSAKELYGIIEDCRKRYRREEE